MFKLIKQWFQSKPSKTFLDVEFKPVLIPNLDNHPVCPKYISLKNITIYSDADKESAGLFSCESRLLLEHLQSKDRRDAFTQNLITWLHQRDDSNNEVYALSSNTVYQARLGFFLDELIEHNGKYSVFCPQCNTTYQPQQIKYIQLNGSWVTRHAYCPNEHEIFSQEIMHIMFKEGAARPLSERIVKDYQS